MFIMRWKNVNSNHQQPAPLSFQETMIRGSRRMSEHTVPEQIWAWENHSKFIELPGLLTLYLMIQATDTCNRTPIVEPLACLKLSYTCRHKGGSRKSPEWFIIHTESTMWVPPSLRSWKHIRLQERLRVRTSVPFSPFKHPPVSWKDGRPKRLIALLFYHNINRWRLYMSWELFANYFFDNVEVLWCPIVQFQVFAISLLMSLPTSLDNVPQESTWATSLLARLTKEAIRFEQNSFGPSSWGWSSSSCLQAMATNSKHITLLWPLYALIYRKKDVIKFDCI